MKHFFSDWKNLEYLFQHRRVVIFSDYDGTLTPIVARPSMAVMKPQQREVLQRLCGSQDVKMAVISGRQLSDVKKQVQIPGLMYAGNHGLEIESPKIKHVHPAAVDFEGSIKKLHPRLLLAFALLPEVMVESKKYALSVHYRLLSADQVEYAKMILLREVGGYLKQSQLTLMEGKKVWEIRPPTIWNKGKTVLWLLARLMTRSNKPVLPVYLGDDITDEDAFQALSKKGITIKVTDEPDRPTAAHYYLRSSAEVFEFFARLISLKKSKQDA